jgi:hypothetical protein
MRQPNGALPWPLTDPDKAFPWVEERIGLALADSQVAAIRLALMSEVLVMTGGPGVGGSAALVPQPTKGLEPRRNDIPDGEIRPRVTPLDGSL